MKNPFPLASAIAFTSYPAAVAAELVGVLPSSVVNFPTFVAFIAVSGVLALVVTDYSPKGPAYDARKVRQRQPRASSRRRSNAPRGAAWVHRTVSS
jgi:hypothetical protein